MSESPEKESTYTYRLYLVMQGIIGLIFAMIFTVELLYHVEVVKLDPLRLVLLGTILEGTIFLCEVPTGILADVKSRKLSIIIGYILMGTGVSHRGRISYICRGSHRASTLGFRLHLYQWRCRSLDCG